MKLEQLGKIVPRGEACVLLRNSTSVTNLASCSFLLASCLPSPNPKWHLGAKLNQQPKSEMKRFYQSNKGKPWLCAVTGSRVAGVVGWEGLRGREDKAEEDGTGGRRCRAWLSRLLDEPLVCSRFTGTRRAQGGLQDPRGRWCRFYSAPCCGDGNLPKGREMGQRMQP